MSDITKADLLEALKKALAIMDHLGDRLNAHDLAFDDKHLDTITSDWEHIRNVIAKAEGPTDGGSA